MNSNFVKYIRAIVAGPCLACTVHNAILERCGPSKSDQKLYALWMALVDDIGIEEAKAMVQKWIDKPYSLKGHF